MSEPVPDEDVVQSSEEILEVLLTSLGDGGQSSVIIVDRPSRVAWIGKVQKIWRGMVHITQARPVLTPDQDRVTRVWKLDAIADVAFTVEAAPVVSRPDVSVEATKIETVLATYAEPYATPSKNVWVDGFGNVAFSSFAGAKKATVRADGSIILASGEVWQPTSLPDDTSRPESNHEKESNVVGESTAADHRPAAQRNAERATERAFAERDAERAAATAAATRKRGRSARARNPRGAGADR